MLRSLGRRLSEQYLEPEGLMGKIFWNKELADGMEPQLRAALRKILILLQLRLADGALWRQNIPI
jgi:hypothetical protein